MSAINRFSSLMGKLVPKVEAVGKANLENTGSWLKSTAKPLAFPAGIDASLRVGNAGLEKLTDDVNAQAGQRMANDPDYNAKQTNLHNGNNAGMSIKDIATNPLVIGGGVTLGSLMLLDYLHRKNNKSKDVTRPALVNEPNTLEG